MPETALDTFLGAPYVQEAFRRHGWDVERDGDTLYVSLLARDGEAYLLRLKADDYPRKPPSVLFVDPETKSTKVLGAWPNDDKQYFKPPDDEFICMPLTREGLQRHQDWKDLPDAWNPARNTLADIVSWAHRFLRSPLYLGRTADSDDARLRLARAWGRRRAHDVAIIRRAVWMETLQRLHQAGGGANEAGCVWVGHRKDNLLEVTRGIFFDELSFVRAEALSLVLPPQAFREIARLCKPHGEQILVDVHTHPKDWVGQSPVDMANPIEFRVGLLALIIPNYATDHAIPPTKAGLHEYLGERRWRAFEADDIARRLIVV